MRRSLIALALVAPAPLAAHPHVFVDTELTVEVNAAGEITGTEMTWTYDEYFTLLILEDMGLDSDMDGELTEDELAELMGFDFETWPEGFEGDLYLDAGGQKIELGHPVSTGIAVTDGKIVATHTRTVPDAPAEGAVFRQYDPTYYVAYTLEDLTVTGGCRAEVTNPDPDAGEEALAEALNSYSEDQFEVLELGIHYADTIRLTCAQPS
ncbi:polyphosphate kinase [Roseivivax halodurans JCM 10272]|uniref:Polyphosphate kinase n=1 Tax=Roseivivax halodurans JCM 10272 TaxID=1449350 RepID=X7EM06_9RHOB|nr:polyphosphate kinase [Roseivivax halodurans JCM 10272]